MMETEWQPAIITSAIDLEMKGHPAFDFMTRHAGKKIRVRELSAGELTMLSLEMLRDGHLPCCKNWKPVEVHDDDADMLNLHRTEQIVTSVCLLLMD